MPRPVVLLALAVGVLLHQVAQAAPPNTKSRAIVLISPSWPMFFPALPPPPPPAQDGPQSRSPEYFQQQQLQYPQLRLPQQGYMPVSILVLDPTRSVASTIQGYVTQATGFVTNSVTNAASNFIPNLPITINIPDIFTGVANRFNAAQTAVQTAWQSRPGNNPTAIDPLPDRFPPPEDLII